jgi:hypothetical protein
MGTHGKTGMPEPVGISKILDIDSWKKVLILFLSKKNA